MTRLMTSQEFKKLKYKSSLEQKFLDYWKMLAKGYPEPEREYQFNPPRKYRFDFAWVTAPYNIFDITPEKYRNTFKGVAVELEGGIWIRGRHVRGKGYIGDIDKYNIAASLGWRVFRFTADHFKETPSQPIGMVMKALKVGQMGGEIER